MSLKNKFGGVLFAIAFVTTSAFAHHQPVKELVEQTGILYQATYNSFLNYQVKNAVYSFYTEVQHLDGCVDSHPNGEGEPVAPYCQPQLKIVKRAYDGVSYYLYDASDVPNVYQAYLATRDALDNVF